MLFFAAEGGNAAIVRALLKGDVNVNITDKGGLTAFQLAEAKGHKDVAALIQSHVDVDHDGGDYIVELEPHHKSESIKEDNLSDRAGMPHVKSSLDASLSLTDVGERPLAVLVTECVCWALCVLMTFL